MQVLQLSIIIVNFRVRYFLEQCLYSVQRASQGIGLEIFVVDNHSADGSINYLQPLFPSVQFMENNTNLGFAKANNQALLRCTGEYVLFLNPDTLLAEDSLVKMLNHLNSHPHAAALGVRMVDGRGKFLPESKRGFPSPWASFCKLSGLSALFPQSRRFNRYALGYLDEHGNHSVDVLAGACLLARRTVLQELNGFDEDYFLYGEDVDLSYRIKQAGYENLYFAGTTIVHFKGESSRNTSFTRLRHFYNAMRVFVQKHYKKGEVAVFSAFLSTAIFLRAGLAAVQKLVAPFFLPLADGVLVWLSLQLMRLGWIQWVRQGEDFGVDFIPWALPLFALLFVSAAGLAGLYERKFKTSRTVMALGFAAVCLLAAYSLLPEQLRFSRGVVLGGSILGAVCILLTRALLLKKRLWLIKDEQETGGRTVVVCAPHEYASVLQLLEATLHQQPLGRISLNNNDADALCTITELPSLEQMFPINRIIFCTGQYGLREQLLYAEQWKTQHKRYLFHQVGSSSMVGSQTLVRGRAVVTPDIHYNLSASYQKRMKRVMDVLFVLVLLLVFPLHFILHRHPVQLLQNSLLVLRGRFTWIGYGGDATGLPQLRPGIVSSFGKKDTDTPLARRADAWYAKDYDWWQDFLRVVRNYRHLG